jgi:hypothetical protein
MTNAKDELDRRQKRERCTKCGVNLIRVGTNQYVTRWRCLDCDTVWVLPVVDLRNPK